jgi:prepilin-type N-terminal cleavage/methylation domain-containing protein
LVGSSGVTLLEVLVAVGLLGLLLGYMAFAWGHQARLARDAREETRMALVAQAQMEMQQANPIRPGDPPFSFTIAEGENPVEYTGTYETRWVEGTQYYWTVTVVVYPRLPGRDIFPLAAYVLNPQAWKRGDSNEGAH